MTVQGHVLLATPIAAWFEINYLSFDNAPMILGYGTGVLIGSLLPDIDESHSYIGKRFYFISAPLSMFIRHRGITHTLFFVAFLILCGKYLNNEYARIFVMSVGLGSLLHIIGDMLTNSGVAILNPLVKYKFALLPYSLRFETNGIVESIFKIVLLVVSLYLLYKNISVVSWIKLV